MVSWGRAFKAAFLVLLFTIVWGIIGAIFIGVGTFALASSAITYQYYYGVPIPRIASLGAIIGIVIVWIIGILIIYLGSYASYFKILTELIVDETRKISQTTIAQPATTQTNQVSTMPTSVCPKCGTQLTYVEQYQRWYCPTCGEYR